MISHQCAEVLNLIILIYVLIPFGYSEEQFLMKIRKYLINQPGLQGWKKEKEVR